ncbi:Sucrase/ferredoxin-like-domain-containing protein [Infundibulicybe gibba]|nr:Sucrase/ferredoxin-like-domain-containing protein [Infundibulicybe gibba]
MGHELNTNVIHNQLEASAVPVSTVDCRSCPNPCDEGHESYPNRFDVDMETQMLGSVKPYHRQVVISTGKSDWDREVTETKGSLAAYLQEVQNMAPPPMFTPSSPPTSGKSVRPIGGIFRSSDSTKISILNGSHRALDDEDDLDTVLVFPDYKVITEIPRSMDGAQSLWDNAVDPSSHKKRDNRCSIAAPKLERAFIQSLEQQGWVADTQCEHPADILGSPLEDQQYTREEAEDHINSRLTEMTTAKRALILRSSHIGGHKYAGNCIIYTPQGSSVWYGRVTPHEVNSIVTNTIVEGLILPQLLRGGLNISRPGCKTLLDW